MASSSKVAIVTGGSKGIGASSAELLACDGFTVVITYSSDPAPADALIAKIGKDRPHLAVKSDAGKVADIEALVKQVVDKYGRLDVVVANAGIMSLQSLADITEEKYERSMALNVRGPLFLAQCHNAMVSGPYLLYIATKGAVEQMVHGLAKELAPKEIAVNAVAPGPTGTELFYQGKSEEMLKTIASFSPFKRLGKPEDIAGAIGFLAGESSGWVSGQTI